MGTVNEYVLESTPAGLRTWSLLVTALREAGAAVDEADAEARRLGGQWPGVEDPIGFETADIGVVRQRIDAVRERFPGLVVDVREVAREPGRHERRHDGRALPFVTVHHLPPHDVTPAEPGPLPVDEPGADVDLRDAGHPAPPGSPWAP